MNSKRHEQEYRTFPVSLLSNDGFMLLGPLAVKVYLALRLKLPTPGIGLISRRVFAAEVNASPEQLECALTELSAAGFIRAADTVVWIIGALREVVGLSPANERHRAFVASKLANVPGDSALVAEFRVHYAEWFTESLSDGSPDPQQCPSKQVEVEVAGHGDIPAQSTRSTPRVAETEMTLVSLRDDYPGIFTTVDRLGINSAQRFAERTIASTGISELAKMLRLANERVQAERLTLTDVAGAISDIVDNGAPLCVQLFRKYLENAKPKPLTMPRRYARSRPAAAGVAAAHKLD